MVSESFLGLHETQNIERKVSLKRNYARLNVIITIWTLLFNGGTSLFTFLKFTSIRQVGLLHNF